MLRGVYVSELKPKPEAVSPERAAELLDVSVETIRRHIQSGKLPALRVGHQYRILLSDLRRAYSSRQEPTPLCNSWHTS
jgi:excisionase family DNA binding protein